MEKLEEIIKNEFALKCALELNKAGIIISVSTNSTGSHFHFSNGKKVGYIQFEQYGAFTVSTQYLSTNCGTGANFIDRTYDLPIQFNDFVAMANALFAYTPNWVKGDWKFYDNFKHFQLHTKQKWNIENILIIQNDSVYTVSEYFI